MVTGRAHSVRQDSLGDTSEIMVVARRATTMDCEATERSKKPVRTVLHLPDFEHARILF